MIAAQVRSRARPALRWRPVVGLAVAPIALAAVMRDVVLGPSDAHTYYTFRLDDPAVYAVPFDTIGAHHYPPPFAQALAPLQALPYEAFVVLWAGLHLAMLLALVGPLLFGPVLALSPFRWAIWNGNMHLEFSLIAVLGVRYGAVWAIPLLTKITPGIGLLYLVGARRWRAVGVALGVTGAIVAASVVADPSAWQAWLGFMETATRGPIHPEAVPVPLLPRLVVAGALALWAGRTGRAWLLPLVMWLSLPSMWWGSVVILVAMPVMFSRRRP